MAKKKTTRKKAAKKKAAKKTSKKKATRKKAKKAVKGHGRKTSTKRVTRNSKNRHLVKRKGHMDPYDKKKIYGSVYYAAIHAHHDEGVAEKMADKVMKRADAVLSKKQTMSSLLIKYIVIAQLEEIDHEVAVVYEHLFDVN